MCGGGEGKGEGEGEGKGKGGVEGRRRGGGIEISITERGGGGGGAVRSSEGKTGRDTQERGGVGGGTEGKGTAQIRKESGVLGRIKTLLASLYWFCYRGDQSRGQTDVT